MIAYHKLSANFNMKNMKFVCYFKPHKEVYV